jgi:putative transposase
MPWKSSQVEEQRWEFLQEALQVPRMGFAALCRKFGISRRCGYKWRKRALQLGQVGLRDRSRRPRQNRRSFVSGWRKAALALHARHYLVGARKIRALLRADYPGTRLPSERTIHRWMRAAGLVRSRPAVARPVQCPPRFLVGYRCNDVWTLDFKGWFYTGDGRRVQLLTVRDKASHYLLATQHVDRVDERSVARCLRRLFRCYGQPKAIRVDRGAPFSSNGPRHWSRLSVDWISRGIAVQISRRASPQDNAAHEQMHGVLKNNVARSPAATLAAQLKRTERWRRWYNEVRPHQALRGRTPAQLYRPRPHAVHPPSWLYLPNWVTLAVNRSGYIRWQGRSLQIGRAFYARRIALCPRQGFWEVYFGPHLLGTLHADEHLIRPVDLSGQRRFTKGRGLRPLH